MPLAQFPPLPTHGRDCALSKITPDIPCILLALRSCTPHPVGHPPHAELMDLGSCSWREETDISEHLFHARHGPRIFHIYGLIQSFPFAFEKGIFTPVLYVRNWSLRERATCPSTQLTRIIASFIGAYCLPSPVQSPKHIFTSLNSHNNPRKRVL